MSRSRRWFLILVTLVLAATAVRLGFWQLSRLATRRAANAELHLARGLPPIDLQTEGPTPGRRGVARGHFDPTGQLLLRGRVHQAAPGVHVVTPFIVDQTGGVIWVLRGFVRAADGVQPGNVPEPTPGQVEIRGVLQPLPETADSGHRAITGGDTTWQRFDAQVAHQRRPEAAPLLLYLEGGEAGPGGLATVEPPALDDGPHLSYAIQWFGIALAVVAFAAYALRKRAGRGPARPDAAP